MKVAEMKVRCSVYNIVSCMSFERKDSVREIVVRSVYNLSGMCVIVKHTLLLFGSTKINRSVVATAIPD